MSGRPVAAAWLSAAALSLAGAMLLVETHQDAAAQSIRIGAYRPRLIVVFLDETGSRGEAWEAMRNQAALIASRLKNRDAFALIGIDDHGGDEDDVRVPLSIVQAPTDLNVAMLNQQRQEIVQQVTKLRRRGNPQTTDIVGPIKQALGIANMLSRDRDVVLAFFSDMQQDPKMPDAAAFKGIQFPTGTTAYCFYVAGTKRYDFPTTVDLWQRLLTSAGIRITTNDFHQQGTVAVGVNAAFPR
jgi:hypothetical protein